MASSQLHYFPGSQYFLGNNRFAPVNIRSRNDWFISKYAHNKRITIGGQAKSIADALMGFTFREPVEKNGSGHAFSSDVDQIAFLTAATKYAKHEFSITGNEMPTDIKTLAAMVKANWSFIKVPCASISTDKYVVNNERNDEGKQQLNVYNCDFGILSRYNPTSETIQKTSSKFVDKNWVASPEVSRVLLLGSNFPLWDNGQANLEFKDGHMRVIHNYNDAVKGPEISESLAFASILHAKQVFDKHCIPSTIMYMPSDLPSRPVNVVKDMRTEYNVSKTLDPIMARLLCDYGYSGLPVVSNQDSGKDKSLKEKISNGSAIWYALESEFRSFAGHLLEKIVKRGIESVVEQYNPLGLAEWRYQNSQKKWSWKLVSENGTYYINFGTMITRENKKPIFYIVHIPIGMEIQGKEGSTAGAPKCAMITSSILMKSAREYGFSHLLATFHSDEAPVASGGLFLSRWLFEVPIQSYVVHIDRQRFDAWLCTANGKGVLSSGNSYSIFDLEDERIPPSWSIYTRKPRA